MITQKQALELLKYEPETGVLIWKSDRGGTAWKDTKAGYYRRCANDYLQHVTKVKGKAYTSARLIWLMVYGEWPDRIDHIDQNPSNNKLSNLRNVTHQENLRNKSLQTNNTSGMLGVHFNTKENKWIAAIGRGGGKKYLGIYDNFFEACCARKSAEVKYGYHPNHGH